MGKRIQLAFISNAAKRKSTCRKRKNGLKKKMDELSTLCGVDVCAIIHSNELDPQLEYWPSESETKRVVAEFQNLSQREQRRNMVDVEKFTRKSIAKADKKLQQQVSENRQMELTKIMFDCLAGRSELQNPGVEDLDALERVVDRKLEDVEKRIEELMLNDPGQVGASTSNAGTMAGGAARD